jgi:ribosomal-protein-alanine N-acetyltransferase
MHTIDTERLTLRRFCGADTEPYIAVMTNPAVTKYLGSGKDNTREDVIKILSQYESVWNQGYGVFAVVEKTSGTVIGHCGVQPIHDGRIEILYAYGPSAWGKGYATEAGRAVLVYAKEHFGLRDVIALAYAQNTGSVNVIKKLGFTGIGPEPHFGSILEVFTLTL